MMEIKICGMTNLNDAMNAAGCGADALGFIFYRKTPRYVTPEVAKDIIGKLPSHICKVGVFVNHETKEIKEIVEFCGLDLIQLHGNESPQYCMQFARSKLIKALSPRLESDLEKIADYPVRAILIDASHPALYGGTGKKSDWGLAVKVKNTHALILSGGLNLDNIRQAIETVSPDAVDINSGVELSPGKKDPKKVRKIIEAVRQTDSVTGGSVFKEMKIELINANIKH
jgi:phosphoribosylanthranilate isomerase